MDDMKKKIMVVKAFKGKGPRKLFVHFWFLNHYLKRFLMLPPKDGFAHVGYLHKEIGQLGYLLNVHVCNLDPSPSFCRFNFLTIAPQLLLGNKTTHNKSINNNLVQPN
jgi:hypothetical protein